MTEAVKKFIEDNIKLIEAGTAAAWEELYKNAHDSLHNQCGKLTDILLAAGIHPEEFLDKLPSWFLADSKIDNFTIPSNINVIGYYAFSRCRKLRDIEIPSSVKLIDWYAFAKSALERITIPNTAKLGDNGIFSDCSNLSEVILEDGITEIPARTFDGCKKLMRVVIPKSITDIGYQAFANCGKNLTIEFAGTTKEWRSLSEGSFSRTFYVAHCIDGDIRK